jgi:hypothetical protein
MHISKNIEQKYCFGLAGNGDRHTHQLGNI